VGRDISIRELAEKIAYVVGYTGAIFWDTSKPDGAPRKFLDSSRMFDFGWKPKVEIEAGLIDTYQWFLSNALKAENFE
jgi:GDP-L-fucose synthase